MWAKLPVSLSNLVGFTPGLLYSSTNQKFLSIWKLVELNMLNFSDCTRTRISILTSPTDKWFSSKFGALNVVLTCKHSCWGIHPLLELFSQLSKDLIFDIIFIDVIVDIVAGNAETSSNNESISKRRVASFRKVHPHLIS